MSHPYEGLFEQIRDRGTALAAARYLIQNPEPIDQQELDHWLASTELDLAAMQALIKRTRLAILKENPGLV